MLAAFISLGVSAQNKCPNSGPIVTNVSCNATNDGKIEINYPNPCTSYTASFLWSDGQTTNPAINLTCGTYAVTVTYTPIPSGPGNPGGTGLVPYSQTYSGISVACGGALSITNPTIINPGCNSNCNGSISFSVLSSSNGPINYVWDNGIGSGTGSSISISGLCPGPYNVTITDNGGCSIVEQFNLTASSSITVSNISVIDNECLGNCTGEIDFTATSPNGGIVYNWSNGLGNSYPPIVSACAGIYHVTITDNYGCSHTETFNVGNAQASTWHKSTNNTTGQNDVTKKVLLDQNGDVYVMGEFIGATTIEGQTISAGSNSSQKGVFMAKYTKCGDPKWLVHSENPNNTNIDIEAFDIDFNNSQQDIVLFSKQNVDNSNPIHFKDLGNSLAVASNKYTTSLSMDASTGTFIVSDLIDYIIPTPLYADLQLTSAKANGNDYYVAGRFGTHAKAEKFNNFGISQGNVFYDIEENNLITDIELDGNLIYAGANLFGDADFGLGLITQPGAALVVEASTTPTSTPNAQLVSGGSAVINDIEIDSPHQLHVVGNYTNSIPGWAPTQSSAIFSTIETGYYVKFSLNLASTLTAFQVEATNPGSIQNATAKAISIYSNRIHVVGTVKGIDFKIITPSTATTCISTSGFGLESMWVAKFDFISTPSVVIWSNGSSSQSDISVTDIFYDHTDGEFFVTGHFYDDITLPPSSSLLHPSPGINQSLGFTIRGGEFQSPNSGYYYKKDTEATISEVETSMDKNNISVFPNPSNGNFKFQYSSTYIGEIYIEIKDITGKTIEMNSYSKNDINFNGAYSTKKLNSGFYLLFINENNSFKSTTLVIQ